MPCRITLRISPTIGIVATKIIVTAIATAERFNSLICSLQLASEVFVLALLLSSTVTETDVAPVSVIILQVLTSCEPFLVAITVTMFAKPVGRSPPCSGDA